MSGQSFLKANGLVKLVRHFRSNPALRDIKPVETRTPAPKEVDPETVLGVKMCECTKLDKFVLVWMKKFPNRESVPRKVPLDVLHKAQNQARIRTANLMIVGTVIGCLWAVITGKRDRKAGKSITQDNLNWHKKINEEYQASLATEPKAS